MVPNLLKYDNVVFHESLYAIPIFIKIVQKIMTIFMDWHLHLPNFQAKLFKYFPERHVLSKFSSSAQGAFCIFKTHFMPRPDMEVISEKLKSISEFYFDSRTVGNILIKLYVKESCKKVMSFLTVCDQIQGCHRWTCVPSPFHMT